MEYNRIVAVTGIPGLYELVSSKTDGAIVRSLDDKSTKFVSSRIHNLSHLESIEIYTLGENVNMVEVFNAMKSSNEKLPDVKDNKAVKDYFAKVYPDMDQERVYASDMKKMIKWFEVLKNNDVEIKLSEPEEEDETGETEAPEEKVEKKSGKKSGAEKLAASDEAIAIESTSKETAETAKPKRVRKKKTEE